MVLLAMGEHLDVQQGSSKTKTSCKSSQGIQPLSKLYTSVSASRDSLVSNDPEFAYLSNSLNVGPQVPRASDGVTETAWVGQFVRTTYDIGNEWSLMGTLRYDGSSRFGLNNRFGLFPFPVCGMELDGTSMVR